MNVNKRAPIDQEVDSACKTAVERAQQALRMVEFSLPHLAGLTRQVRLRATDRVYVAGVSASGLVLIRPSLFATISLPDAMYVMAHELMHLALDTHGRLGYANPRLVNIAHDMIINDMLSKELEMKPPLNGLHAYDASEKSLEQLVQELGEWGPYIPLNWMPSSDERPGAMAQALLEAGLVTQEEPTSEPSPDPRLTDGDLIPEDLEREFEPEISLAQRTELTRQTRSAAVRVASLTELKSRYDARRNPLKEITSTLRGDQWMQAIFGAYDTPWEMALQRWFDAVSPGIRDYSRPSRRSNREEDFVRAGRRREGWTLHIVLDTSGSMANDLPGVLGAISHFCQASGVIDLHLVQCDSEITRDGWIEVDDLGDFELEGFGGSDLSPAMEQLANDPDMTAVLVLTDGYVQYPYDEPPYRVLWGILGDRAKSFRPPYGEVIQVDTT